MGAQVPTALINSQIVFGCQRLVIKFVGAVAPKNHTITNAPSKEYMQARVRPRFFDQVEHQTTNASIGNKYFFTK